VGTRGFAFGVKGAGRWHDNSPPSSADIRNGWS
jgi:hypothetical protein